jgi:hypothetical protein
MATVSLSLIVIPILGPKSSGEERLEAEEILELGSKTFSVVDSWEERVDDGELRYLGLEFRVRRRFEGAVLPVRRRFGCGLRISVAGCIDVRLEAGLCSLSLAPEARSILFADS